MELRMYVKSPPLKGNGSAFDRPVEVNAYDQGGFTSNAAAAAYERHQLNYASQSVKGFRYRANMQSGRLPGGKFRPTTYSSIAILVDYSKASSKVVVRQPDGKYTVRYRDVATGYIGGFSTGWGNPWDHYIYSFNSGHVTSVLNRAVVDNLDLRARTEVMLRARNQKFDLSESLAGIDLTVLMVANKVRQVVMAWKSVRNGNFALAARHLGLNHLGVRKNFFKTKGFHIKNASLAEQWLALIYGWLPLLDDIVNGVRQTNDLLAGKPFVAPETFTVKRSVTGQLPFHDWMLNVNDDPWLNPDVRHDVRATCSYKYRVRVKDQAAAYLVSLGLDNPLYSLWIAMPYTFVIDWLSPVSDWLQALSAPIALQFVDGYRSRHIEGWDSRSAGPFGVFENDPNLTYYSGPAEVHMEFVEFVREQLFEFPVAQIYFRFPLSSPQRVASAISLVATAKRHGGRV